MVYKVILKFQSIFSARGAERSWRINRCFFFYLAQRNNLADRKTGDLLMSKVSSDVGVDSVKYSKLLYLVLFILGIRHKMYFVNKNCKTNVRTSYVATLKAFAK